MASERSSRGVVAEPVLLMSVETDPVDPRLSPCDPLARDLRNATRSDEMLLARQGVEVAFGHLLNGLATSEERAGRGGRAGVLVRENFLDHRLEQLLSTERRNTARHMSVDE